MLLATKSFDKIDERNFEDKLGLSLDIPTVIIKNDDAEKIRNEIASGKSVLLSIKFAGVKQGDTFDMELFLRADDVKSLHFFREFKFYYNKLSKIEFKNLLIQKVE